MFNRSRCVLSASASLDDVIGGFQRPSLQTCSSLAVQMFFICHPDVKWAGQGRACGRRGEGTVWWWWWEGGLPASLAITHTRSQHESVSYQPRVNCGRHRRCRCEDLFWAKTWCFGSLVANSRWRIYFPNGRFSFQIFLRKLVRKWSQCWCGCSQTKSLFWLSNFAIF